MRLCCWELESRELYCTDSGPQVSFCCRLVDGEDCEPDALELEVNVRGLPPVLSSLAVLVKGACRSNDQENFAFGVFTSQHVEHHLETSDE